MLRMADQVKLPLCCLVNATGLGVCYVCKQGSCKEHQSPNGLTHTFCHIPKEDQQPITTVGGYCENCGLPFGPGNVAFKARWPWGTKERPEKGSSSMICKSCYFQ